MADQFVGEIRMVPFNFAPRGWALCNGQILPISQNTTLFSLLGTYYGGDGKSNFALPNLQGSVPINQGQARTGTQYALGEVSGTESITLIQQQLPAHTHLPAQAASGSVRGGKNTPANSVPSGNTTVSAYATGANTTMAPASANGQNQAHENRQPFLTLNFIISLTGVYPARQ